MTPRVSILTAAYNATPFLAETVRSVLAQSMPDFEMLIVDDGSSDGTYDLAQEYARQDPRIRTFRQANGGVSVARNTALAHSRGGILAILDSDDVWMPDYLAEQLAMFERIPAASIITVNAINRGGPRDGQTLWPVHRAPRRVDLIDIIEQEDSVCIMSCIRREVIDGIGGFKSALRGNEDYHLWLRATNAGYQLWRNGVPTCYYRRRATSLSADERTMLNGVMGVLREAVGWVADKPVETAAIQKQLHRFGERLVNAEMKVALDAADYAGAARHLQELHRMRGGVFLGAAARVSKVSPAAFGIAARLRAAFRGAAGVRPKTPRVGHAL